MRWATQALVVAATLLLIAVPATAAQEADQAKGKTGPRVATGIVTAVTPASRTLVVESRLGGKPWILGVVVPRNLAINDGAKTRQLEDLKIGDRVRLRWVRKENELVAESVVVVGIKTR